MARTDSGRRALTLHWSGKFSSGAGAEGGATSPRLLRAALTVLLFCEKICFIIAVCSGVRALLHFIMTRHESTRGGGSNERLPTHETISTRADAWEMTDTALYAGLHFADGASACEAAPRLRPALAILDVKMPGMDGFEVLRRLRAEPALRHTPVMMLTSMGSEHDVVRGLQLGADDYIVKPFSPVELVARVHRHLLRH